jgi:hypothetical protein
MVVVETGVDLRAPIESRLTASSERVLRLPPDCVTGALERCHPLLPVTRPISAEQKGHEHVAETAGPGALRLPVYEHARAPSQAIPYTRY